MVGTEKGKVIKYDMRYPIPMQTFTHHYRLPIKQIKFHEQAKKMLTCDRKIIKIWNQEDGSLFTNIEPKAEINDIELCGAGSGMIFAPQEQEKIGAYFLPALGPAPKWCTFLEQLTEELEESKSTTLYEDYKFLTKIELEKLAATHLIGTPSLKAYMHGYFMELKSYQKLLSAVNPFAFEEYKKKQVEQRLREKSEKRINIKQKQAQVNVDYVKELEGRTKNKKQQEQASNVLGDDRFQQMFEDKEFAIDRDSENYKLVKPTEGRRTLESDDEHQSDEQEAPKAPQVNKGRDLNSLFAGKEDDSGDDVKSEEGADNYEKKLNKDQRKKALRSKDKIIKNYGNIKQRIDNAAAAGQKSKDIKKTKLKKNDITEQDVRRKLREKRVVLPSRMLK
jgi:ribosome biogenesis protein ENP2